MQPGLNVFVTNHNPWPMSDRWDGIPIEFPTDVKVPVELAAAAHFFGFPVDEFGNVTAVVPSKDYITRRYGWNTASFLVDPSPEGKIVLNPQKAMENADLAFRNLVIEAKEYVLVEQRQPEETLPAPRPGAGRNDVPMTEAEKSEPLTAKQARKQWRAQVKEAQAKLDALKAQGRIARRAAREAKRNPDAETVEDTTGAAA